jgi:hypothetical protein
METPKPQYFGVANLQRLGALANSKRDGARLVAKVVAVTIVAPMGVGLAWGAGMFTALNAAMLWFHIGVTLRAHAPFRAA